MKMAIITGGNRGIGAEMCHLFKTNKYRVIAISKSTPFRELDNVQYMQCDVTNEEVVKEVVNDVVKQHGQLDVLVNSAGINKDSLLVKSSKEDILSQVMTNLVGTMFMCKWAVRHMIAAKSGSIVNIGSVVGQHGNPGQCVYSATKSGLVGFTKSLAKEVGSRGITANVIAPGYIKTDMTVKIAMSACQLEKLIPLHRLGNSNDVAEAALFLVQNPYTTGQVLYCDGGLHTVT